MPGFVDVFRYVWGWWSAPPSSDVQTPDLSHICWRLAPRPRLAIDEQPTLRLEPRHEPTLEPLPSLRLASRAVLAIEDPPALLLAPRPRLEVHR